MRQIQQLADAIAAEISRAQSGDPEGAEARILEHYETFLISRGLRLDFASTLDPRTLLTAVGGGDSGAIVLALEEALAEVRRQAGDLEGSARYAERVKTFRQLLQAA